jgi:exodeoxyribonuclease VII large subunit
MELASGTSVIGVAEYSARIGRALRSVGPAVIEGEVQKPKTSPRGMLYFDLTDGEASLSCKVFSAQARKLAHQPRHGDLIEASVDRPDLWAEKGKLDVIVSDVKLTGEGELLRRREALLRKLRDEGLCDEARRKPLPPFPRAVGVIAGQGSDGMSDVVQALRDRYSPVHVITCAATVQGRHAPRDLIDALARLQEHPLVDVIIVARGGGSVQDLVAFDDERLCRAIFACEHPVVAAIGHTDNVPVCNHVTWAAYTPSRSAEMVVPSSAELRAHVGRAEAAVAGLGERIERRTEELAALSERLRVGAALTTRAGAVAQAASLMERAKQAFFAERERVLAEARVSLASLPRRLPSAAQVSVTAATLDSRAQSFFRDLGDGVHAEALRLSRAGDALAGVASDVKESDRRLAVGIQRQLDDHERDYGHALARLVKETGAAARRRLAESAREIRHRAALIAAHDFRRRGWVLAADSDGEQVSSVERLRPGSRLRLSFGDGDAAAAIEEISTHREETE